MHKYEYIIYTYFRRLSGYKLAGNKIFLRHVSSGDWGGFSRSAAWVEWSVFKRDTHHVGKHSRPTPRLACVVFYLLIYLFTFNLSDLLFILFMK